MNITNTNDENIRLLYVENSRHHLYLIDLRHKILVRYFIAVATLLVMAKWLLEMNNTDKFTYIWAPFLLMAILSLVFFFMEMRNTMIINACKSTGQQLELLLNEPSGIYSASLNIRKLYFSYGVVLKRLYLATAIISVTICGFLIFLH